MKETFSSFLKWRTLWSAATFNDLLEPSLFFFLDFSKGCTVSWERTIHAYTWSSLITSRRRRTFMFFFPIFTVSPFNFHLSNGWMRVVSVLKKVSLKTKICFSSFLSILLSWSRSCCCNMLDSTKITHLFSQGFLLINCVLDFFFSRRTANEIAASVLISIWCRNGVTKLIVFKTV